MLIWSASIFNNRPQARCSFLSSSVSGARYGMNGEMYAISCFRESIDAASRRRRR